MILLVQQSLSIKSLFISIYFLNPLIKISNYLNLWDVFRFIFRRLRMTFFIKLWLQKKNIFLQIYDTILQRVKYFNRVIITCSMLQLSAWQHKHLSSCAFQHIVMSSSAAGCTICWLLMSVDVGCILQLMMTL